MTFQRKLFLGFCLMVLPVALLGAEALRSNREEREALEALGQSMARTRTYAELETAMFDQAEAVWRFLSGLDPRAKDDYFLIGKVVAYWQDRWEAELRPEEMELARDVEELHGRIDAVTQQIFSRYEAGDRAGAYEVARRELRAELLPALTRKNREIYRLARQKSVQGAYARLEEILREERRILFVVFALSLAGGVLASIFISRGLARPIQDLKAAMAEAGEGRLDRPIDVTSPDEIGDLARAFATMTESLRLSHEAMSRLNADLAAKIDQLERTQAQLIQSEKLASIGEMSAAVAHGLRNPLASLRAAAQVALHQMKDTPAAREHLVSIIEEVDRLDRRIGHLLSFSRPAPYRPMPEQVGALIDGLLPTFAAQLEERGISLESELPAELPEVQVDPMQLEQALLEVLSNAIDAMPEGGRLGIRGYQEDGSRDGGRVVIEVIDTGPGIPRQVLPSVCDPFFTTRPEGTGLGLAIAKRYVDQNGGDLRIESEPGSGTTVRISLPTAAPGRTEAADATGPEVAA